MRFGGPTGAGPPSKTSLAPLRRRWGIDSPSNGRVTVEHYHGESMPTKAELEVDLEKAQKTISNKSGQITKLKHVIDGLQEELASAPAPQVGGGKY